MFAVKRILRSRNQLSSFNFICTSKVINCGGADNKNEEVNLGTKKKKKIKVDKNSTKMSKFEMKKSGKLIDVTSANEQDSEDSNKAFSFFIKKSAEKVAQDLGGDTKKTKEDLLNYIKKFEYKKEDNFRDDFKGKRQTRESREFFSQLSAAKNGMSDLGTPKQSLGVFEPSIMKEKVMKLNIWDDLEKENFARHCKQSPRNYFEELIEWTNEGKLWKFPIDNDQGREKEAEISFTEHIFMEQHLEPWCPKRGPLRKFMELVLIGLSKNPYLSLEEKHEHIQWFKNYFEAKKKLLQKLGALSTTTKEIPSSQQ